MVFRKQIRKRVPRRKVVKRRMIRGRINKNTRQPVHYFKRSVYIPGDLVTTGGVSLSFGKSFSLSQLPAVSEFQNLYDQYQIKMIKARWMPRGNSQDVIQNHIGAMFTVIDYDDATTPALSDLLQYESLKISRHTSQHVRTWKPRFNVNSGLGAGNMNTRGWLDMSDITIPYFGIKGHLQAVSNQTITYDCLLTFYVAFKGVR